MGSAARGQSSYGARAETPPTEHRARRQPLRATFPSQGRRGKRPSTDVGKRRIGDQEARPQRFQKNRCGREAGCVRAGGAATNGRHPAKPSSSTSTTAAGFGSAATPTQVQAGARTAPQPPSPVPEPSGEPGASLPPERGGKPARTPVERILLAHVREEYGHLRHLFRGKPGFGKDPADIPEHGEGLLIAAGVVDAPRFGVLGHLPGPGRTGRP